MPRPPVDGLAGVAVSLVTSLTGAVDDQPRLVTVCVQVTATIVLCAEVWSCRVFNKTGITRWVHVRASDRWWSLCVCDCVIVTFTHPSHYYTQCSQQTADTNTQLNVRDFYNFLCNSFLNIFLKLCLLFKHNILNKEDMNIGIQRNYISFWCILIVFLLFCLHIL